MSQSMGAHQSAAALSDDWITPREILDALGAFDLDPCASVTQPWPTATRQYTIYDNGLLKEWTGRVWMNPPYGQRAKRWLARLSEHGNGIALIFARTETDMFFRYVWGKADALLFIRGRLFFCRPNGERATGNAGAPSVLVAYGAANAEILAKCGIAGKYVPLFAEVAQ